MLRLLRLRRLLRMVHVELTARARRPAHQRAVRRRRVLHGSALGRALRLLLRQLGTPLGKLDFLGNMKVGH